MSKYDITTVSHYLLLMLFSCHLNDYKSYNVLEKCRDVRIFLFHHSLHCGDVVHRKLANLLHLQRRQVPMQKGCYNSLKHIFHNNYCIRFQLTTRLSELDLNLLTTDVVYSTCVSTLPPPPPPTPRYNFVRQ